MRPEEQRIPSQRYTVIPRTLVFLRRGQQLLLLKGAPDKRLWAGKYNGLGGHMEAGENPYQAALREIWEEAGLRANALMLRAIVHVTLPEPPGVMLFVFVGTTQEGHPTASEEGEPVWVDEEKIYDLPLVEDLHQLLPKILEPGAPVFGNYHFTESGVEVQLEPGIVSELRDGGG